MFSFRGSHLVTYSGDPYEKTPLVTIPYLKNVSPRSWQSRT
ncbi:MAG TPA: hypothetical protein VFX43_02830 [Chitinophagaceae bacterium]|nr:hypothetical protein [Chitinophagaceae bacterium]